MPKFTYIFLSFIIVLASCSQPHELSGPDERKMEEVKAVVELTKGYARGGEFDKAIVNTIDAINLLKAMERPDHKKLYLYYRNQATFANKLEMNKLAISFADSAMTYFQKIEGKAFPNMKREELSMKRFQVKYLRLGGEYKRSIDLAYELLGYADELPTLHQKVKNNLALAYVSLGDYVQAEAHYRDLLKLPDLDSLDRYFYHTGLAKIASQRGDGKSTLAQINQALLWLPEGEKDDQFKFYAFKDAGRFELLYGDTERATAYLEAALDLEVAIHTKPQYFELYRYLSTAYQVRGSREPARRADLNFEEAENSYQLLNQNVDAVFTHSWLESKRAEMLLGQQAQWLKTRNAVTIFWISVSLVLLLLTLRWMIRSRSRRLNSLLNSNTIQ